MIAGIGIDIVESSYFKEIIKDGNKKFLQRIFTPSEIQYCNSKRKSYEHLAVRYAAKEAFLKALGKGWSEGIRWQDIEVVSNNDHVPQINLYGIAKKIAMEKRIKNVFVSLSHDSDNAIAQVILEKL